MFKPGTVLKTFTSKKGNNVIVRTPEKKDVSLMTDYMNEISKEDTFISFGGEQLTLAEEEKYMDETLDKLKKGDCLKIFAFIGKTMVGNADVNRMVKRSKHVGILGITVKDGFRKEGIGKILMDLLIEGAKKMKLKMIELTCFANNSYALNLYEKTGFRKVGKVPGKILYKGEYIDEVIMVKSLS